VFLCDPFCSLLLRISLSPSLSPSLSLSLPLSLSLIVYSQCFGDCEKALDSAVASGWELSSSRELQQCILQVCVQLPYFLSDCAGCAAAQSSTEQFKTLWEQYVSLRDAIISLISASAPIPHCTVVSAALKFAEQCVLAFSPVSEDHKAAAKVHDRRCDQYRSRRGYGASALRPLGGVFSFDSVPPAHAFMSKAALTHFARELLINGLIPTVNAHTLGPAPLSVAIHALGQIGQGRPAYLEHVVRCLLHCQSHPDGRLSEGQKHRVFHDLKLVFLDLIRFRPAARWHNVMYNSLETMGFQRDAAAVRQEERRHLRGSKRHAHGLPQNASDLSGPHKRSRGGSDAYSLKPKINLTDPNYRSVLHQLGALPVRIMTDLILRSMGNFPPVPPSAEISPLFKRFCAKLTMRGTGDSATAATTAASESSDAASAAADKAAKKKRVFLKEVPQLAIPQFSSQDCDLMATQAFQRILSASAEVDIDISGQSALRSCVLARLASRPDVLQRSVAKLKSSAIEIPAVDEENGDTITAVADGKAKTQDEQIALETNTSTETETTSGGDEEMADATAAADDQESENKDDTQVQDEDDDSKTASAEDALTFEGGASAYEHDSLLHHVVSDIVSRYSTAVQWLYTLATAAVAEQHDAFDQDTYSSLAKLYSQVTLKMLEAVVAHVDNSRGQLTSAFVLDMPVITNSVFSRIEQIAHDPVASSTGVNTLIDLIKKRTVVRSVALSRILPFTAHSDSSIRSHTVAAIVEHLFQLPACRNVIRSFAIDQLNKITEPYPEFKASIDDITADSMDALATQIKDVAESDTKMAVGASATAAAADALANASGAAIADENIQTAPTAAAPSNAPSAFAVGTANEEALALIARQLGEAEESKRRAEQEKIRQAEREEWEAKHSAALECQTDLFLSLCKQDSSMIGNLAVTYAVADKFVRQHVQRSVSDVVTALGNENKHIVELVSDCPKSSATLALKVLTLLCASASAAEPVPETLKEAAITASKVHNDARFIVPVLPYLPNNVVRDSYFASVLRLPEEQVKDTIRRLVTDGPDPVKPVQLLVWLHDLPQDMAKVVMSATNMCLSMSATFSHEVLAQVLQRLFDRKKLPFLYMRTLLQSLMTYPKQLTDFGKDLLSRLQDRKVWLQGKSAWNGYVKCIERRAPHTFPVAVQLPEEQFKKLLNDAIPKFRNDLVKYVRSSVKSHRARRAAPMPPHVLRSLGLK
jgi:Symplekin tight junction protein C terminal/Symplekin/PTA1 N-terminal